MLPAKYWNGHCRNDFERGGRKPARSAGAEELEQGRGERISADAAAPVTVARLRGARHANPTGERQIFQVERRQVALAARIELRVGERDQHGGAA